jgi:class 3 adenylate cyclase
MQQIADWLEKLGMSEYAQRFAENDIDFEILGELTDQDLEKIGVASLGHRRKLLRAIANLEGIQRSGSAVAAVAAPPITPQAAEIAERRQVTVMFSDLVGSTALSSRMDPEDLREVISAYQKCVAETVQRFGGFVAKYMGDGVLIYFGYPQAHEDDAERAVRSGLELVVAVGALKTHAPLQTRIGIATGIVVVGDLIGTGASQEQAIVGETPNLAARLQSVAEPNSVVIAESTQKLVGNLFELEDLGARDLRGIAGPVRAWAALRPASVKSRFEALHASGLTALVGREEELDLLYSARMVDTAEAELLGLVRRLPADNFCAQVQAVARELVTASSPRSIGIIKRQVFHSYFQSLAEPWAVADKEMIASFGSEDFKEGVAHFVEKRTAMFSGR